MVLRSRVLQLEISWAHIQDMLERGKTFFGFCSRGEQNVEFDVLHDRPLNYP